MKWTALTLVLIGLVAVDGAWEPNREFRYKLSSDSSDSSSSSSESAETVGMKVNKNNEINKNNNECRTLHQTQYARVADHICFSTRQLPMCSMECKVEGKPRQVDAYCIHEREAAAQLYLRNIQQGRNPRMDRYPANSRVSFNLPFKCVSDESGINMYRGFLDELDATFAELTGY